MTRVQPQWTERLYRPGGGQDHLGLGSVSSDQILPRLAPGIQVQTVHARYWSLYTFLLDEFWNRDLPRSRDSYAEFYRPREAIYAAGALLCDRPEHQAFVPMTGVVGSGGVGPTVRRRPATYDPALNYIKGDLGGYGLYYAAPIASHGLILRSAATVGLPFDAPTPEGKVVADGFRRAIASTAYYRNYFDSPDRQVPADVVLEYIRAGCLCQLRTAVAPDRVLLRRAFFQGGTADDAGARRATFRLVLDLADQTTGHAISEDRFRQLVYFRSDGGGAVWTPREASVVTARRWRLYQAREYYAYALNRLWRYLVEWGQSRIHLAGESVPLSEWHGALTQSLDFAPLASAFGIPTPGVARTSPLAEFQDWAASEGGVGGSLDEPWDRSSRLNEHTIYQWAQRDTSPAVVPGALAILALVASRLSNETTEVTYASEWAVNREGGVGRLSLQRFLTQWRRRVSEGASVADVAHWLMSDYVIRQHERVATTKLTSTGDTFRFRTDGEALRFYSQDAPAGMNSSRFDAVATVTSELGLMTSIGAGGHSLTPDGCRLLESEDADWT